MDKELLRIAIIGTGLIIMVAMIVSAYLKNKQATEEDEDEDYDDEFDDEYDDDEFDDDELESTKKPSITQALKNVVAQKMQPRQKVPAQIDLKKHDEIAEEFEHELEHEELHHDEESPQRPSVSPAIIQFSVITKGHEDFNIADVFHVLEGLGLEYGSMKIFERIDEKRFVHFGVASMVEPGTFPDKDLENFYCPGVVFFMQMDGLDDPQTVFDDYVATAVLFAQQMDGVVLDHRRQPLTNDMVDAIRAAM
jgi:cell division protein ZipA